MARHYRTRKGISAAVTCARVAASAALALCAIACGSSSSSPGQTFQPTPTTSGQGAATITITPEGVRPVEVSVQVGQRVTFLNNDTIAHLISGGPDPAHPDCLEIDAVGFLSPGQRRDTQPFPTARMCEYHDHGVLSPLYTGRIVIR